VTRDIARIVATLATLTALVALAITTAAATTTTPAPIVMAPAGPIRGILRNGAREFLGIPYAAPPVGNLRWRAPQPYRRWNTVLDATHLGSSCPQFLPGDNKLSGAEDCLVLNIYTSNPPRHDLPVMVWIHGGAFILGSGADVEGSALAKEHNLIVVAINYRLGALGFLVNPSLDAENPAHISGNYGLLDQQAALKWVKRNIGAFGGDQDKVAIAGESAGGISVCDQLASPVAAGLFRAAIIESGPCLLTMTRTEAEKSGRELVARLGCDKAAGVAACLRSKRAAEVVSAMPGDVAGPLIWAPVVDGKVIPNQPLRVFHKGTFNKVPVINGSNRDEGTLFVALGPPISAQNYAAAVSSFADAVARGRAGHDNSAKVMAEYPLSHYESPAQGFSAVLGDAIFSCPIEATGELLSAFVPAYEYEFNDRDAPSTLIAHPPFPLGAYHTSEIQYVFQTPFPADARREPPQFSAAQQELSDHMAGYWASFIASGTPDGATPAWSPDKPGEVKILSLSPGHIGYESEFSAEHHCAFWKSLRARSD
jgi:para-nitrobenzyl esterase